MFEETELKANSSDVNAFKIMYLILHFSKHVCYAQTMGGIESFYTTVLVSVSTDFYSSSSSDSSSEKSSVHITVDTDMMTCMVNTY